MQMGNLKGLLGLRKMDRIPNTEIRELCRVKKRVDESVPCWFVLAILKEWKLIGLLKGCM